MIPYARQDVNEADIEEVVRVLRSDWLTQGPAIGRFEDAAAKYLGAGHAVAVSSGTAALHLACLGMGLKPGDWLWTSPVTFVASANCALFCGARADFVDIDARSYNLSVECLEKKLDAAKKAKKLPKILIPVHLAGQSCEMASIFALSKKYGFKIIEDASQAIGGSYRGKKIGRCEFSDAAVFSFHPAKTITTGEGGMVTTNDDALAKKIARLRTHGITRDPAEMEGEPDGPWHYQQLDLGLNYRMTDIQAALGLSQLRRIDEFIRRRTFLAERYDEKLKGLPITTPRLHPDAISGWHLYVVRLKLDEIKKTHRQVFEELRAAGIGANLHHVPVHLHPYYQKLGFKPGDFPQAEKYYREAITLPLYTKLSESEQDYVVQCLENILG